MNQPTFRILDANFNRAREGLRVLEEHARFVLEDASLSERAKQIRHGLAALAQELGLQAMLSARSVESDIGTTISTATERVRSTPSDVIRAAAARVEEAIRCIEEYGKLLGTGQDISDQPTEHEPGATATPAVRTPDVPERAESLRYAAYDLERDLLIGGPRRVRLQRASLHVLVTESLCSGNWLKVCEQALRGGADVLQLREKNLTDRDLLERATQLRQLTREHQALLVINDRPDIAVLSDADGVHLGQEDLDPYAVRDLIGANRLIGVSTHSIAEAESAVASAPDYIGVGPMFSSPTKSSLQPQGPALLKEIAEWLDSSSPIRLVAIGGITPENAADLRVPANHRVQAAVCQSVIAAEDPSAAAATIRKSLENLRTAAGSATPG